MIPDSSRSLVGSCGKSPPVRIIIQASLPLLCALRVNGRETCTDTVSQRTVWLRGPLIITDRATDSWTDRQTVPQRAQTGPGSWSRPDKYKETRGGGAARTAEGGGKKINPAAAARLHRPPDTVTATRPQKPPSVIRDKAMRDGDK